MELAWVGWAVVIAVSFGCFEAFAIKTKRPTLSRTVWNISKSFPAFGWIVGMLFGFLGCHFFWGGIVCFK